MQSSSSGARSRTDRRGGGRRVMTSVIGRTPGRMFGRCSCFSRLEIELRGSARGGGFDRFSGRDRVCIWIWFGLLTQVGVGAQNRATESRIAFGPFLVAGFGRESDAHGGHLGIQVIEKVESDGFARLRQRRRTKLERTVVAENQVFD